MLILLIIVKVFAYEEAPACQKYLYEIL